MNGEFIKPGLIFVWHITYTTMSGLKEGTTLASNMYDAEKRFLKENPNISEDQIVSVEDRY